MPRNSSGTYTLPLPPVEPNTTIEAYWANTTDDDIAQALTDSLDRYGRGGMVGAFRLVDGTVSVPAWAFASETNTGMYRDTTGVMAISILGVRTWAFTATASVAEVQVQLDDGTKALPALSFTSDNNTGLYTEGTQDTMRFVTGGEVRAAFKAAPGFHIGDNDLDITSAQVGLYNRPRLDTSASSQYGIYENTMFGTTATVAGYGLLVQSRFAAGAFATADWSGVRIGAPVLGAGRTISDVRGLQIDDLDGVDSAVGILSLITAGADKYFLYGGGDAKSFLGGTLRIQEAAYGGGAANSQRDALIIEQNTSTGMSFLTPNTAQPGIAFGDPESNVAGQIRYAHSTDTMDFITGGSSRVTINSSGMVVNVPLQASNMVGDFYMPTITPVANCSVPAVVNLSYVRVGYSVTVAGRVGVTQTASGVRTVFGVSLPFASSFTSSSQAAGSIVPLSSAAVRAGYVAADTANNRFDCSILAESTGASTFAFQATYMII